MEEMKFKLAATQFLKATGVLDAYEAVIDSMVTHGWPADSTIYEHASYELLKWHAKNSDQLHKQSKLINPGSFKQPREHRNQFYSVDDVLDASEKFFPDSKDRKALLKNQTPQVQVNFVQRI